MKRKFYLPGLVLGCLMLLSSVSKAASVPVTSSNLQNDTVCSGASTYFIFGASDTSATPAPISYVWQLSTNGGSTWTALTSGGPYTVTGDSLKVNSSVALNGYKFRSIATNTSGSDTSFAAMLKVDTASWGTITGPTSVCVGAHVTLVGTVAGGTWSMSNDSATISALGIVTGVLSNGATAGHDTVFYALSNTCGSHTDTAYISINTPPSAGVISGPSIVCKLSTITLTESVTGGVWSRVNAAVDSVSSTGIVTGLGQGIDTIKYSTSNAFCTSVAIRVVRVDTTVTALPISGPSITCVGHIITLTNPNVLGTWTWTVSNTHASISSTGSLMGLSAGMDTVTYNFTNACNSVSSTTTIQVDAPMSPGVISGPTSVCAGSWIHLSETISGGVWFSSNSALAVVDGSGNVTGVAQGDPIISYVVSNGCGAVAATHSVHIARAASIITGIDSVGIGATRTLSDSATGGTWSILSTSIATISSTGVVTGIAAGTTTVSYTVINACGTSVATRTVYVGPSPTVPAISGPDSVCVGANISLSNTVTGGSWNINLGHDTIASINSSGDLHGILYGSVIVTYSYTNAFGTTTRTKTIFVNDVPNVRISGPNIVSLGGNYFLFGAPSGGTWTSVNHSVGLFVSTDYIGDTAIGTEHHIAITYGSYVVTAPGTDTLKYTVRNTCGTTSKTFVLTLAATDNHVVYTQIAENTLSVYPNPNNGEFTISLTSDINGSAKAFVTNIVGEKVMELDITTNKRYDVMLNQPAGIYVVNIVTENGEQFNTRIVINK